MKLALMLTVVLGTLFAQPAEAARVDRRAARQQARIGNGLQTGQLTAREAVRLETQQAKLQQKTRAAGADDGHLDAKEKAKLEKRQDRMSKRIWIQKHDAQTR
jgi:hypothetical protein